MRTLQLLQDEVKSCTSCDLHKTRTNTVFSRGNPIASLCFVGESPGEDEDLQGLPFVGRSGQLLDKILFNMGVDVQTDIYICNMIKCRPPKNRKPTEDEVNECSGFLQEQFQLVNPKVVVALGNTAASNLILMDFGITKIRGKFFKRGNFWVMPTFHPSYLLRNNNPLAEPYLQFQQDIASALIKVKELT